MWSDFQTDAEHFVILKCLSKHTVQIPCCRVCLEIKIKILRKLGFTSSVGSSLQFLKPKQGSKYCSCGYHCPVSLKVKLKISAKHSGFLYASLCYTAKKQKDSGVCQDHGTSCCSLCIKHDPPTLCARDIEAIATAGYGTAR